MAGTAADDEQVLAHERRVHAAADAEVGDVSEFRAVPFFRVPGLGRFRVGGFRGRNEKGGSEDQGCCPWLPSPDGRNR